MSSVITDALGRVRSGHEGKEQYLLWKTSLATAVEDAGFVEQNAAELASLVLEAVKTYNTHKLQRVVLGVARSAMKSSDVFVKALAAAIVKACSSGLTASKPSALSRHEMFGILALIKLAMGSLDPETAKKAVQKLLEVQSLLADALMGVPLRWQAVSRVLGGTARMKGGVGAEMLELAKAAPAAGPAAHHHIARALLEVAARSGSAGTQTAAGVLGDGARSALLAAFCDKVVNGKERVTPELAACYSRLFTTLTQQEWTDKVVPALTRSMRRTPEVALGAAAALLGAAQHLDASSAAGELGAILLQQIRVKEAVRPVAVEALRALASRVTDISVAASLVGSVRSVLDGSAEGKIKVAAERVVLAHALHALSGVPGRGGAHAVLAADVAAFAAAASKEEANEEAKAALLALAGAWLGRVSGGDAVVSSPEVAPKLETVAAVLAAGMRDMKSEAVRRAHLRAAVHAMGVSPDVRGPLAALAEPGWKLVVEAAAKPASMRADGILGALVAAYAASASNAADAALQKEPAGWAALAKPDSPLISLAVLPKVPATATAAGGTLTGAAATAAAAGGQMAGGEAARAAELSELLLTHFSHRLDKVAGSTDALCNVLVVLACHWSRDVRAAASGCMARAVAAAPDSLLAPLAAAHSYVLNNLASLTPIAAAPDAAGEDGKPAPSLLARRVALSLPNLVSQAKELGPAGLTAPQLAALLLAAHHPALTGAMAPGAAAHVWHVTARRLPNLPKALPGLAAAVCQVLWGPLGVGSQVQADREAGARALGAVMAAAPNASFPHVLEGLAHLLDRTAHDALTEEELDIYETPEAILSSERVPEGVYVGEVVESKNVRKARGRFKTSSRAFGDGGDDDDDEPAPVVRKPAAAPPAPKPGAAGAKKDAAARQAEWRATKLAEEAAVRARVGVVRATLQLGASTLVAVVGGNTRFAALKLEELRELCLPLVASRLVGPAVFRAIHALACCLPPPLSHQALSTTAALRLVVLAQQGRGVAYTELPKAAQVADVVHALREATKDRRTLAPSAYRFVFPVLQAVLSSPVHTPLHDEALAVVAQHCGAGPDVPRADTLRLLYHSLGVIPAYRDRVLPLLRALAGGCTSDEEVLAAARGTLHGAPHVRAAALGALPAVPSIADGSAVEEDDEVACVLHVARHDPDEANAAAAKALWEQAGAAIPTSYVSTIVTLLTDARGEVQAACAAALASAAQALPGTAGDVLARIIAAYEDGDDNARRGAGLALRALAPELSSSSVNIALDFLIRNGLADEDDKVREAMVAAGVAVVDAHGAGTGAATMMPLFEGFLDAGRRAGLSHEEEVAYDLVRTGVVVFLGTLARHLPPTDPKRRGITEVLVGVLATPSEAVQRAVSQCLPPLMAPLAADREYMDGLVQRLLNTCTKGKSYGERRGAAFGLAGLVKGLGTMAMRNAGIMDALKAGVEDKKDAGAREGALLAFECLSDMLGKLFEPYVIHTLPLLLACFGDPAPQVRQATEDAARVIMGQLSASGVKLVLPALLEGLNNDVWRTKQGSAQLLGSMAYCAPKQLGSCLPTIVPRLSQVLSDPHPKVQTAANEALREIGSVIRNPEISSLVPALLAAIADPNGATRPALDTLLETVFVNTIDAASLALIMPVIHRGLRDRVGETKKRAARIAGNMASLVNDPKDMVPYVPLLMPELQKAVVDPLPEVRAMSARAMGSLMQGMGSEQFSDLVPWLMGALRSEGSSVERQGAAQGLAEVIAVLGTNHLEALLPQLLDGCRDKSSVTAREGHVTLLHYLPATLEAQFQPYLGRVLPAILDGLSDEGEGVRDAALQAGRIFVDHYANTALPLLLPAVEEGVLADNWRIRQASLKLLGKLLFKVAGTTGNIVLDGGSDDEGAAEEGYNEAIINALGLERRNEVLSRLYIARSDPQYPVRNEALHVWKSVVHNTPKTLGQILPTLMAQIIESMADEGEDRRVMAGRALGELVRKMGERVLHRIIPILKEGAASPLVSTRQGVCAGMTEVLENIGRHQLAEHIADLLPAVQAALCDEDAGVRTAAGAAFSIIFRGGAGGGSAVDSVVPSMLEALQTPGKYGESLEGLRVILGVRPQIFNFVLPKLLKAPLLLCNITALGALAGAASTSLAQHLHTVMPPLLTLSNSTTGGEREEAARESAVQVALAVEPDALHLLVPQLLKGLEDTGRRRAACELIAVYVSRAGGSVKEGLQEHLRILLDALISLFSDEDTGVVAGAWKAVDALAGAIPKEEQAAYVGCVKEAVATAKETERRKRTGRALKVAGLCLGPKALAPLVPIYLAGMQQGSSNEVREEAAEGLGELVVLTSDEALKPFVTGITGALIKIVGDRFPAQVKVALLATMGALIRHAGWGLKIFASQLQTTFLKCLADPADGVRLRAATNLGELAGLSPKVDALATNLVTSARSGGPQIRDAYLVALRGLLLTTGDKLTPATVTAIGEGLRDMHSAASDDEPLMYALAAALGAHAKCVAAEGLRDCLVCPAGANVHTPAAVALHACTVASMAGAAGPKLVAAGLGGAVLDVTTSFARDPNQGVRIAAGRAASRLAAADPAGLLPGCAQVLSGLLGPDQPTEVARQAALATRRLADGLVAADSTALLEAQWPVLVPPLCALINTTTGPAKGTCERSLSRVLGLDRGLEGAQRYLAAGPGGTVRSVLTEPFMRRLAKLSDEDELFAVEEY